MILNIDLLGIPGSEVIEHDGVKGVFIPEIPNYRYSPAKNQVHRRGGTPERAIIAVGLYKMKQEKEKKFDYFGRMTVWPEYREAYLSNPKTVNRKRYMVYGYNWLGKKEGEENIVTNASDFEKLLSD